MLFKLCVGMYVCAREGQRVVSAPLELELKVAEGAGNDPHVVCRNSMRSSGPSLSSGCVFNTSGGHESRHQSKR